MKFIVAALTFASAMVSVLASKQCFMEPFPSMLEMHITNEHQCGINNPHIINWACEPVRGLVPDAVWLEHQLAQYEDETVEQPYYSMEGEEEEMPVYDILGAKPSANPFPRVHNPYANYEPSGPAAVALSALGWISKAGKTQ